VLDTVAHSQESTPAPADVERAGRIRDLLKARGWTQARAAKELDVSQSTVESWVGVTKAVKPHWPHLARMAELFDVTPGWIETGDDRPAEPVDPVETLRHDVDQLRGRVTQLGEQFRFIAANTERITKLEGATDQMGEMLRDLGEALVPLTEALQSASADRRRDAGSPPPTGERRRVAGRRRNDQPPG